MTIFRNDIEIEASAEKVFAVLLDFNHYPNWHTSVRKITGEPGLNNWLVLHMGKMGAQRTTDIPVEITVLMENRVLEWQGSLFKKGALRKYFLVRHAFYIEDLGNNRCRFTNEEQFYALFSWPVKLLKESFRAGYQSVNQALKAECEK